MKKLFFTCIFSSLIFSSCYDFTNIETPETLSISSSARYQLPAGNLSFKIAEELSAKKLRDILTEENEQDSSTSASVEVYYYNPNKTDDDIYRYILNYPIKEIPLSFSANGDISNMHFDSEISISSFLDTVKESVNQVEIKDQSIKIPEGLSLSVSEAMKTLGTNDASLDFNITNPDFETMTLKSGTLNVSFVLDASSPSSDFYMPVQLSLVSKKDNSKVIASSDRVYCEQGGTVTLDLAGKDLEPEMQVLLDGSVYGGTLSKINSYKISFKIDNIAIKKITGLNLDLGEEESKISIDDKSFEISDNSALKSAEIKKGSMGILCELPEGWSGIKCTNSDFSLSGAVTSNSFTDDTENAKESDFVRKISSLSNVTLDTESSKNVNANGNLEVSIENATIEFHDDEDKIQFGVDLNIEEIGTIEIDLTEATSDLEQENTIETGLNFSTLIGDFFEGDDTSSLVKNIKFPESDFIEAYLYINQSTDNTILNTLAFQGYFNAVYDTDSEKNKTVSLGGLSENPLSVKKIEKTFSALADENYEITSNELFQEDKYTAKIDNMAPIINDMPDNLCFNYKIELKSGSNIVTLDNDDFQNLKTGGFSISLAIILPLQIILDDVSDGTDDEVITLDNILEITGNTFDEDMLKRDGLTDSEDWLDYTAALDYIALKYELINTTPLDNLNLTFHLQQGTSSTSETIIEDKELDTASGQHSISFTREEIEALCNAYPIIPTIKLKIGNADGTTPRGFKRNSELVFKAILEVQASGQPVKIWDKNDK